MAAVRPAQPEPRITVSRISVIRFPTAILDDLRHQPIHPSGAASSAGRSVASLTTNSPNRVLAHANHGRVKLFASSFLNDSCMNPVPAVVSRSHRRHWRISRSSVEVMARYEMDMGQ